MLRRKRVTTTEKVKITTVVEAIRKVKYNLLKSATIGAQTNKLFYSMDRQKMLLFL